MGDIYFLKTNQHVINEKLYVQRGGDFVLQQVAKGIMVEQKKLVQFALIFHLLS